MSTSDSAATMQEMDLTDRIAAALPLEVRADFYRELRHCRSLPENDEMLRILRIMQFLTLLTYQFRKDLPQSEKVWITIFNRAERLLTL